MHRMGLWLSSDYDTAVWGREMGEKISKMSLCYLTYMVHQCFSIATDAATLSWNWMLY